MKQQAIIFICLLCAMPGISFSQAKGNYMRAPQQQEAARYDNYSWDFEDQRLNGSYTVNIPAGGGLVANNDKEMVFQVNALLNAKADAYLAIFNLTQLGESASEADKLLNEKVNGFKSKLSALGIGEDEVTTDIISLKPIYEFEVEKKLFSKTYTEVPKGFELQKNIHVRFDNSQWLDAILTLAADNEIYDLVTVDYFVDDTEEKYSQLRKKSIEVLKNKLTDFEDLGIKLDTAYKKVVESRGMVMPIDRYKTYSSYQSAAFQSSGRVAEVSRIRKPTTYFYEKLPYEHFDVVIEPEYLEPVVQYVYSLKVKYVIEPKPKKVETHHIMVTPEGVVKTLKID